MSASPPEQRQFVIVGGGPAGLTAAYELTKLGYQPLVFEQAEIVGGIARTEQYRGYYFDMGGHRFFTKSKMVQQIWEEILGDRFLLRPRLSRIYYQNKFFHYPLKAWNAFFGLGPWQALLTVISFLYWQLFPYRQVDTFEQWVTNRFGRRLFQTFFKVYTEKVWGIPTSELKAEWAAQRIKDLSLKSAILTMFFQPKRQITSLIEQFHYPERGPGLLWQTMRERIEAQGGQVVLKTEVVGINVEGCRVVSIVVRRDGCDEVISGTDFIFSMPVSDLVKRTATAPAHVQAAADQLRYRDFLTVCLIVNQPDLFPDNWIYVHAPEVQVGRIQNYKNWSPAMVPQPDHTSLGLEYFCNEGDELWTMADADLIALAKREIERVGLARAVDVVDGCVFRVPKAYPIYDSDYRAALDLVRDYVDGLENLQTVGRNGLHRYNNQDHSMITAVLAVRNLLFQEQHDLWNVNAEQAYHEESRESTDLLETVRREMAPNLARVDPLAFGLSLGITVGLALWVATVFLILKGGDVVGPNLSLLNQFLPGFSVTWAGGLVGLLYMLVLGFVVGSVAAYLRNVITFLGALLVYRDIEWRMFKRFLDYI